MNKVGQAEKVHARLLETKPSVRARVLRSVGANLDLRDHPDAQIATACVHGLGPRGIRELIVAVGLWLAANDITEMPADP